MPVMIPLESLECSTFEPLTGQDFTLLNTQPQVSLHLAEVRRLGHRRADAQRDPFALTFRGAAGLRLPQQIYRFEHASLGTVDIFIAQVAAKPTGSEFEAIFT